MQVRDEREVSRYAQGDRLAEMLLCRRCGVLVSALWREQRLYGVVNANVLDARERFGSTQPVSPRALSADAKTSRWLSIWFANVARVTGEIPEGGGSGIMSVSIDS